MKERQGEGEGERVRKRLKVREKKEQNVMTRICLKHRSWEEERPKDEEDGNDDRRVK